MLHITSKASGPSCTDHMGGRGSPHIDAGRITELRFQLMHLTPVEVRRAEAAHNKRLVKWSRKMSDYSADLTIGSPRFAQESRFQSSPPTRAARTLEITRTDIVLQNGKHHVNLSPSHGVMDRRGNWSCHRVSNSFKSTCMT